jgi:hypothetical protein
MKSAQAPSPAAMIRRLGLSGIPGTECEEPFPTRRRGGAIPAQQRLRIQSEVLRQVRDRISSEGCLEARLSNLTTAVGSAGAIAELKANGEPVFIRRTSWPHLDRRCGPEHAGAYCERVEVVEAGCPAANLPLEVRHFESVRRDMSLSEICDFQEKLVKEAASTLTADDVGGGNMTRLDRMIRSEHPRITYREAIGALRRRGFAVEFGHRLGSKYEGALLHYAGYLPVHVTHFPGALKPFNVRLHPGDESVTETSEYIFPFSGRTAECAELESDPEILRHRLYNSPMYKRIMKQLKEMLKQYSRAAEGRAAAGADQLQARAQAAVQGDFEDYISQFETQPMERAGFSLCAGRLLQYVMGSDSLAETLPAAR